MIWCLALSYRWLQIMMFDFEVLVYLKSRSVLIERQQCYMVRTQAELLLDTLIQHLTLLTNKQ